MAAPEMLLRGLWASHAVPTSVTSVADSPVSSEFDLDVSALDTVDMNSVSPTIAILEEGRHLDIETSGNNRSRKGVRVHYDVSEHVCDDDISYESDVSNEHNNINDAAAHCRRCHYTSVTARAFFFARGQRAVNGGVCDVY